jgi:hypothetical protein
VTKPRFQLNTLLETSDLTSMKAKFRRDLGVGHSGGQKLYIRKSSVTIIVKYKQIRRLAFFFLFYSKYMNAEGSGAAPF